MNQRGLTAAVVAVGLATAVGACGSSSKSGSSSSSGGGGGAPTTTSTSTSKASAAGPSGVKVSLLKVSFGKVVIGPNKHTVYLFEKDTGTTSKCNGKCAKVWTPLTTSGKPRAGSGLKASLLATSKRKDGMTQVTYG